MSARQVSFETDTQFSWQFSFRVRLPRPLFIGVMAPKRPASPAPRGSVAEGLSWQALQTARLEAQAKALGGGSPPSVEAFAGALYMPPHEARPRRVEDLRESESVPVRSADAAARLLHRRTEARLLKTSFEPQRHSVIVAGRPVQVPGTEAQSKYRVFVFPFHAVGFSVSRHVMN